MNSKDKGKAGLASRTVEFKPDSRNLFFHILTACNLKCRHCYINPSQHGTETLDLDTLKAWLRLFSMEGSRLLKSVEDTNVIFLGGEPTMSPHLADAIKYARALGYASITVDTNGYLFNDILERVTPQEVDFFSFSLDGVEPGTNDPIRGSGSFDVCTAGIRRAVSMGFNVSSIFTCSRMNIHDLPRMPDLLKSLGVKRFFIQVIGIRGKSAEAEGQEGVQLRREEWQEVVPRAAERAAELGLHVTWPMVFLDLDEKFECAGVVAENYFVFPNGRVYTCPLCEDYPLHAYEIVEDRLLQRPPVNEMQLYELSIPEGCVMNRLLHPGNIEYDQSGRPLHKIACCMLKEEILPA